jgi:predicted deacylase
MTEVTRTEVRWGSLPDGTPLAFPRIDIGGRADGPHVAFTGGVHGDEYEGPLALLDLARTLARLPLRGRVTILPFVNAPALSAATRASPLDGANLARIFPGSAEGTLSHRLARAVWSAIETADALVDCHAGGVELAFMPVAGFYAAGGGVDAASAAASRALAEATGLPDLWRLPPTAGVLSCEAARRGIAVTGCEIGGRGGARPADVALYHDAFLRVLAARGLIDPVVASAPAPRVLGGVWRLAPVSGLFRPVAALGAAVKAGETVARIEALTGDILAVLDAPHGGVILAERNLARIREGDLAIFVAEVIE